MSERRASGVLAFGAGEYAATWLRPGSSRDSDCSLAHQNGALAPPWRCALRAMPGAQKEKGPPRKAAP